MTLAAGLFTFTGAACKLNLKVTRPTLANEMLAERHNVHVSAETVRQLMTDRGMWRAKVRRGANAHPMRERRSKPCFQPIVALRT